MAIGAQPREARERLPGVQFGCYEVCRFGGFPCCAWGSANVDDERCIFGLLRVGLFKINRLMIAWAGTHSGRLAEAANPSVYKQN